LIYELISEPTNFSGVNGLELSFDYAFAQTATNNQDKLTLLSSTDCGQTWTVRKIIQPTLLNTAGAPITSVFVPTSDQWQTSITSFTSSLWVDDLQVMFRFQSGGGNHIYLDNINFFDPAQASVMESNSGQLYLYPNPAQEQFSVIHPYPEPKTIQLIDMTGRIVKSQQMSSGDVLPIGELAKGVYLISLCDGDQLLHKMKIIKN
jgi:hypothetical protein